MKDESNKLEFKAYVACRWDSIGLMHIVRGLGACLPAVPLPIGPAAGPEGYQM